MAEKRVKKQEVRVKNSIAELRGKSLDELQKLLATARKDLLEAQKSLKADELANPHAVKKLRREIARIMTVMAEMSKSNNEAPLESDEVASNGVKKENE